jgi:hypothetical protein
MTPVTNAPLAAPVAAPARAGMHTQLPLAVPGAGGAEGARGDGAREREGEALPAAREALARRADPDAPAGPPPAFAANVLDVERARLKEPPEKEEAEARPASPETYAALPEGAERKVDLAL